MEANETRGLYQNLLNEYSALTECYNTNFNSAQGCEGGDETINSRSSSRRPSTASMCFDESDFMYNSNADGTESEKDSLLFQIQSLKLEKAAVESELVLARARDNLKRYTEKEARVEVEMALSGKECDAEHLLQELIDLKVSYACLSSDYDTSKHVIARLKRSQLVGNNGGNNNIPRRRNPNTSTSNQQSVKSKTSSSSMAGDVSKQQHVNIKEKAPLQEKANLKSVFKSASNILRLFED